MFRFPPPRRDGRRRSAGWKGLPAGDKRRVKKRLCRNEPIHESVIGGRQRPSTRILAERAQRAGEKRPVAISMGPGGNSLKCGEGNALERPGMAVGASGGDRRRSQVPGVGAPGRRGGVPHRARSPVEPARTRRFSQAPCAICSSGRPGIPGRRRTGGAAAALRLANPSWRLPGRRGGGEMGGSLHRNNTGLRISLYRNDASLCISPPETIPTLRTSYSKPSDRAIL